ncbi:hypothetical protein SASPL_157448 [Salvia splendens]|uniref:Uncharacterized protein n=1 Tax=Salvia splendens TaxID=180675 RepID=A0A8X8VUW7_SALSN|nr:hypothetical protein SASPL_157448 [Salvia splendens]
MACCMSLMIPSAKRYTELKYNEMHKTSKLVEWRETPLLFRISNPICMNLHHYVVRFFLNICIVAQILLVSSGKLVLFLSVIFWRAGESQLPDIMVKRICKMADRMIREVPSLCSQEPPNCWSLPIVTLTAIALALTNTRDDEANQLLASVTEGLSIVKLIEKTLDKNGELESIIIASDAIWIGVEIVTEFMAQPGDVLMHGPLNWPSRVIAANSMYRIAQSILVRVENGEHQSDAELFGKRHKSVRRAARLLGESKEILEILQQHELPRLDVEKVGNIDEWRASMALGIENPLAPPST